MKRADHFGDITYENSAFHTLFRTSRLIELSADRETQPWSSGGLSLSFQQVSQAVK